MLFIHLLFFIFLNVANFSVPTNRLIPSFLVSQGKSINLGHIIKNTGQHRLRGDREVDRPKEDTVGRCTTPRDTTIQRAAAEDPEQPERPPIGYQGFDTDVP